MPVGIATQAAFDGISSIPYGYTVLRALPWLALLYILKLYFGGASNALERNMHSKVVMMTGATSGIGASVAHSLASRGAQLVLLTHHPLTDPFLQEYILDLRARTSNNLVTAEHCDLSSLHSIRMFATKWVDNAPPRRLDMLILCGSTVTPRGSKIEVTEDGVETMWGVNYLANFHLLSILSPAIRAQPADRDVRVILGLCGDYVHGQLPEDRTPSAANPPPKPATPKLQNQRKTQAPGTKTSKPVPFDAYAAHAASQLALLTFGHSLQSHFSSYKRPDLLPPRTAVLLVDPGLTRTPGLRRYLTFGSLWGLLIYILTWPFWWLVLKSPDRGAQSFLYAAMEEGLVRGIGGGGGLPDLAGEQENEKKAKARLIKECSVVDMRGEKKREVEDEDVQRKLWQLSEATVEVLEKEGAVKRAKEKKEKEERERYEGSGKGVSKGVNNGADMDNAEQGKKPGSRRSRKS